MAVKILNDYGKLHHRLEQEPGHRLSKSQKESMLEAAKRDPGAYVSGLDEAHHPVVCAKMPGPGGATRYALDRAGTSKKVKGKLVERW